MKKFLLCLLLLSALYVPDAQTIASTLTLHDAAFSPDGETIGVGTDEGFQLLDKEGKRVLYSYPMPEGVQFLKWSPDSRRVLLVSWKEQEIPVYSLLDIEQNRILFSVPEKVRWYYYFRTKYDETDQELFEEIYPRSTELGHPAAMAYSPNGKELAYITEAGPIRVRDTETGSLLREFSLPEYHATSLGYTPDGGRMWVGIIVRTPQAFTDTVRLLYLNSQSGAILEKKNLYYDVALVKGHNLFWVYTMRPDQKYALAVTALEFVGTKYEPTLHHYVVDMNQEKPIASIAASSLSVGFQPFHRAAFGTSGYAYGLQDWGEGWDTTVCRYPYMTVVSGWETVGVLMVPVPAQPFSPDGSHFLMIQDDRLYITETATLQSEIITLQPTAVNDYRRHEWMLGESGERE